MDEEALHSFKLPQALDPIDNRPTFHKICFLFLLPQDNMWHASETRLPESLRKQLYRQSSQMEIDEVDLQNEEN